MGKKKNKAERTLFQRYEGGTMMVWEGDEERTFTLEQLDAMREVLYEVGRNPKARLVFDDSGNPTIATIDDDCNKK